MIFLDEASEEDHYTSYIYINSNSLDKDVCSEIMTRFDNEPNKQPGHTLGGVNAQIKDTKDLVIPQFSKEWEKIYGLLKEELTFNVERYINKINDKEDLKSIHNHSTESSIIIKLNTIVYESIQIQSYIKNQGRYIYHNDARIMDEDKSSRIITFLWYLNDVDVGGETVFDGKYAIRPRAGTLVLFPSTWTYIHCGKMPISSDKYIMTGWLYQRF